ncbi:hypothetical protein OAT35_04365 [Candidatus Pelagibacter sp.]|nr:hypothetical protein [Candidatus Pelagibacter sp.]
MKSKFLFNIFIYNFVLFFLYTISYSEEQFILEGKKIKYEDSGKKIFVKDEVYVDNLKGIKIRSDELFYDKSNNILYIKGNIKLTDELNQLVINSDEIEYDRNTNNIISKNKTSIIVDKKYYIDSEDLKYSITEQILTSDKKTVLKDDFNNNIESTSFVLLNLSKTFKSKNLKFTDSDSNKFSTLQAIVDLRSDKLIAKDIEYYLGESANNYGRIKGRSIVVDNDKSIIKKANFTSCKPSEKCPPWNIQSEKVTHDKNKKTVYYDNAILKLYDTPIFYFPKFFHPDPTVKRQSGFLIPSYESSNTSGNAIKIPYYHVISDNADFTIQPRLYTNQDLLIENEFRFVTKNFEQSNDFSIKKLDQNSKSHFFSNSKFLIDSKLFDNANLEINYETTSNDTYIKKNNLTNPIQNNQSLLTSFLKFNANDENTDFLVEAIIYEDLNQTNKSDKYQFIYPNYQYSKLIQSNFDLKGDLVFKSSGKNELRDTNIAEKFIINDLEYNSDFFIFNSGMINNFSVNFKNTNKDGKNSPSYDENLKIENFISANFYSSLPLTKKINSITNNFTPKWSINYSPLKSKNNSSLERRLSSSNIFSKNRLALNESLEGGQSLTVGFDYDLIRENQTNLLSSSFGQIFRDINDKDLPKQSKMQTKSSDIVGEIFYNPNDYLEFNYNFSADNNLDTVNYNLFNSKIKVNNFITTFEHLEETNEIGSNSYFARNFEYKFNESNSLNFNTRRNRKTDLTEFYDLIYQYQNDCLVASIKYNKSYYEDNDIKPSEEIFFSLTITPFASINTPSLK